MANKSVIDKFIEAFQKVIANWGCFEILMTVIFFPWSAAYIALRVFQEYNSNENTYSM